MRFSILLGFITMLLLATAAGAEQLVYEERFEAPRSPAAMFGGRLLVGPSGPWTGSVENNSYRLQNDGDPNAVFYQYIDEVGDFDLGAASAQVTVRGRFGNEVAGAGLVYRFNASDRSYLAFSVSDTGYVVWERTVKGFRHLSAGTHAAVIADKTNRLAVNRQGDKLVFSVNGEKVTAVADSHGSGLGMGLFVVGLGDYVFDDFAIKVK